MYIIKVNDFSVHFMIIDAIEAFNKLTLTRPSPGMIFAPLLTNNFVRYGS